MKFGQVPNPELIDFTLPPTNKHTLNVLDKGITDSNFQVYVGCAKWNKTDLKGFYPKGTKDELVYYAQQFNSIELNATFYNTPSKKQVETWRAKVPMNFKFFPKIPQSISHYSRLLNTEDKLKTFIDSVVLFEEKLGCVFLQMHENFNPKDFDRLKEFVLKFPKGIPLAVEVRNEKWFSVDEFSESLFQFLEENNIVNVIVDTAGRRDMLHFRLTNDTAFVRFVGANHPSDYDRLNDWIKVIKEWRSAGLNKLYFFIHQNIEVESPMLATHFIMNLNETFKLKLPFPQKQISLF